MTLLPALREKLHEALSPQSPSVLTHRDAALHAIAGKAHAVIGMRRAGKTCFLKQLLFEQRREGPPERAIYLNFDDDRIAGIAAPQLDALLEEFYLLHPRLRRTVRVVWYLDEVQMVQDWERFVRRVLDTEAMDIVVSGSSARMLSREIHTALRGRAMETIIRPFSFREVLRHRNEEPGGRADRLVGAARSLVEKRLREYLTAGGFPEAQGVGRHSLARASRIALLQGYIDTVLFRDVIERHSVTQVAALRWMVRQALRNPCGAFSASRFYSDLRSQGHNVAKDTVHALLQHLVDAFAIAAVPVATESERRRNTNPRKLYPADHGLIEAFDSSGRSNRGHALETMVHNELVRRGAEVAYVKTVDGFEVDFLARHADGRSELIQVCADLADSDTWDREMRALDAAAEEHPKAERMVIALESGSVRARSHPKTRIIPASQWLLSGA